MSTERAWVRTPLVAFHAHTIVDLAQSVEHGSEEPADLVRFQESTLFVFSIAPVVQPERTPPRHGGGRGFNSRSALVCDREQTVIPNEARELDVEKILDMQAESNDGIPRVLWE